MTSIAKFLVAFILIAIVDTPFIMFVSKKYDSLWPEKLELNARTVLAFLTVYTALASSILFVAFKTDNPVLTAFITGLVTYTTYSFTVYGIYSKWPLWLAGFESVWGGILLATVTFIMSYVLPRAL